MPRPPISPNPLPNKRTTPETNPSASDSAYGHQFPALAQRRPLQSLLPDINQPLGEKGLLYLVDLPVRTGNGRQHPRPELVSAVGLAVSPSQRP